MGGKVGEGVAHRGGAFAGESEAAFARRVDEVARQLGWRPFGVEQSTRWSDRAKRRIRNIIRGGEGFPDRIYVRRRDWRIIFAEYKRDKGPRGGTEKHHVEPTEEQKAWLDDLTVIAAAILAEIAPAYLDTRRASPIPQMLVRVWRPSQYDEIVKTLT